MRERLRVIVTGAVQGVGFRPFVFRLAGDMGLDGWVLNGTHGVTIEVEGAHAALERFLDRLLEERPPRSVIQGVEASWLDPAGHCGFEIRESSDDGAPVALVLPDIAACPECVREIFDPTDRRFGYPFTNCTNCGPRYSIIHALPYDRASTSMRGFAMCEACRREYGDPADRRFHAQPNACPACGPRLSFLDVAGTVLSSHASALAAAVSAIRDGWIVAVKGLGGFHLVVRADDEAAVRRLRERKRREEKPFAIMFGSLEEVERELIVSPAERRVLTSPEAPIVLLDRRGDASAIARNVAPGIPSLGVLLPYTPLHHLLLREARLPIVATSGNRSDEPICIDTDEALERLSGIADFFLVHDRPIVRHVDDSIVRVVLGRELVLRRARGYAPLPIPLRHTPPPLLAVGAHLKNTVAITVGANAFISQHIGDLETPQSLAAFTGVIASFRTLYRASPERVIADLHPDYLSSRHAATLGLPVEKVQHHYAHVAGCMAENQIDGPALGVSWDGTGYGADGSVWGGEFLRVTEHGFERVATLRPFRLPGNERAVREPRRSAFGLLHALRGASATLLDVPSIRAFDPAVVRLVSQALERGVNAPWTTSAGRLFDAVASLTDLRQTSSFEGQAAMDLEASASKHPVNPYPFTLTDQGARFAPPPWEAPAIVVDWGPLVEAMLADISAGVDVGVISARFHASLARIVVDVALASGESRVVLTGGCFQNRTLLERAVAALRESGLRPYWHQRVPPNDGGISLGQIAAITRSS